MTRPRHLVLRLCCAGLLLSAASCTTTAVNLVNSDRASLVVLPGDDPVRIPASVYEVNGRTVVVGHVLRRTRAWSKPLGHVDTTAVKPDGEVLCAVQSPLHPHFKARRDLPSSLFKAHRIPSHLNQVGTRSACFTADLPPLPPGTVIKLRYHIAPLSNER